MRSVSWNSVVFLIRLKKDMPPLWKKEQDCKEMKERGMYEKWQPVENRE